MTEFEPSRPTADADERLPVRDLTKPIPLEYHVPQSKPINWHRLQCVFWYGPITGAMIGFAQISAAVLYCVWNGEFYFCFDSWPQVRGAFAAMTVGGAIVGIGYGAAVCAFEDFTGRRCRMRLAIPVAVSLAFDIAVIINAFPFLSWNAELFIATPSAFVFAFVGSALASRHATN